MEEKNVPKVMSFDISEPIDLKQGLKIMGCGDEFYYTMLQGLEP